MHVLHVAGYVGDTALLIFAKPLKPSPMGGGGSIAIVMILAIRTT